MDPVSNETSIPLPTPGNALSELPNKIADINATLTPHRTPDEATNPPLNNGPDNEQPNTSNEHQPPTSLILAQDNDNVPVDPALTETPTTKPVSSTTPTPISALPGTASRKRKIELIDAFEEFRAESPDGPSKGKSTHRTLQPFKKGKHHSIIEIKILRAISQFVADFDLNVKQCEIDEYLGFKQRTSRRARTTKTKSELVLEGKLERHPRADNARKDLKEKKRLEAATMAAGGEGEGVGEGVATMYADTNANAQADANGQADGGDGHHEEDYQTLRALFEPQPV